MRTRPSALILLLSAACSDHSPTTPTDTTTASLSVSVRSDSDDALEMEARSVPASAVVILETASDDARTDSVGLRHTLDAFGIAYDVTRDASRAVRATDMLVVAGQLSAAETRTIVSLTLWAAEAGHTLWLSDVSTPQLLTRLGLYALRPDVAPLVRSSFTVATTHPLARYVDTEEEETVQMFPPGRHMAYGAARGSAWSKHDLATYADGTSAVVTVEPGGGGGRAVVFGQSFSDLLTRAELGTAAPMGCTDKFFASLDTVRLFFRRGYELYAKHPRVRAFAPGGKRAAVILTHDMDAADAYVTLRDQVLPLEHGHGYRSTLFVTTSYRSNHWISGFYGDDDVRPTLLDAQVAGHDVESHSVAHLPDFAKFPLGDTATTQADYQPSYSYVTASTTGGAVRAEVGISRRLLREDLAASVEGFRAGYLAKPRNLLQAVAEAGYTFDSSTCAGEIGGSMPYMHLADYRPSADETNVLEVPLSISDYKIADRAPEQTLATWIDVTRKNANNGAPTVMLLHPTNPDQKMWAYTEWLAWLSTQDDLWVGTMSEYVSWYRMGATPRSLMPREGSP